MIDFVRVMLQMNRLCSMIHEVYMIFDEFLMEEVDLHYGYTDYLTFRVLLYALDHQVGFVLDDCKVIHLIDLWST